MILMTRVERGMGNKFLLLLGCLAMFMSLASGATVSVEHPYTVANLDDVPLADAATAAFIKIYLTHGEQFSHP
jgi:hypothetical protein